MHSRHLRLSFSALLLALPLAAQSAPELHGDLREVDGVAVLSLRGDDRQNGFTEGYLCAERIVSLMSDFALSDHVVPNPILWNALVLPRVRRDVVVPESVRERCAGILEGIEARDPDLLEIPELNRDLTVDDLLAIATIPDFVGMACSSFAAWGDQCEGEGPLVGRNLDYFATPELLRHTMVIVRAPYGDRAGVVSIGWPGFAGCLTGFSEHGVSVAIHDVSAKMEKDEKVTPRTVALQELIERWRPGENPAEEARERLAAFRFGMGGNAMVAWRGGPAPAGAAVYELWPAKDPNDGVTVRGAEDDHDFVVCSNHHRARVTPEKRCWRYFALFDGLAESNEPLDMQSGWELIAASRVDGTLYRALCDLDGGDLRFELRRKPRASEWDVVSGWNVHELLRRAAANESEPEPAGASGR